MTRPVLFRDAYSEMPGGPEITCLQPIRQTFATFCSSAPSKVRQIRNLPRYARCSAADLQIRLHEGPRTGRGLPAVAGRFGALRAACG